MKIIELFEEKDASKEKLVSLKKVLSSMGYKTTSEADTPGVRRAWMIPKSTAKTKYDFMSASAVIQFVKDFESSGGGELKDDMYPEAKDFDREYTRYKGAKLVGENGFKIVSQNDDTAGQIVVSVPRNNRAGEKYKMGYDT